MSGSDSSVDHDFEPSDFARSIRLDERVRGMSQRLDRIEDAQREDRKDTVSRFDAVLAQIKDSALRTGEEIRSMQTTLAGGQSVVRFVAWAISILGFSGVVAVAGWITIHH